jgi:hypothetical protein
MCNENFAWSQGRNTSISYTKIRLWGMVKEFRRKNKSAQRKKGFAGDISQRARSISFPREKEDLLNVLSASQKLQKF